MNQYTDPCHTEECECDCRCPSSQPTLFCFQSLYKKHRPFSVNNEKNCCYDRIAILKQQEMHKNIMSKLSNNCNINDNNFIITQNKLKYANNHETLLNLSKGYFRGNNLENQCCETPYSEINMVFPTPIDYSECCSSKNHLLEVEQVKDDGCNCSSSDEISIVPCENGHPPCQYLEIKKYKYMNDPTSSNIYASNIINENCCRVQTKSRCYYNPYCPQPTPPCPPPRPPCPPCPPPRPPCPPCPPPRPPCPPCPPPRPPCPPPKPPHCRSSCKCPKKNCKPILYQT